MYSVENSRIRRIFDSRRVRSKHQGFNPAISESENEQRQSVSIEEQPVCLTLFSRACFAEFLRVTLGVLRMVYSQKEKARGGRVTS